MEFGKVEGQACGIYFAVLQETHPNFYMMVLAHQAASFIHGGLVFFIEDKALLNGQEPLFDGHKEGDEYQSNEAGLVVKRGNEWRLFTGKES